MRSEDLAWDLGCWPLLIFCYLTVTTYPWLGAKTLRLGEGGSYMRKRAGVGGGYYPTMNNGNGGWKVPCGVNV